MRKIIIKNTGFTLVELLVVVSIIAILSVIGLTLFSGAQQNARDARRKADIDAIAKALESKKQPGGFVYSNIAAGDFSGGVVPTDTTTQKYVINLYTTENGARSETCFPKASAWATAKPSSVASGGVTAAGVDCQLSGNWPIVDSADLSTTTKSWKVCAKLENTTSAAGQGYGTGTYCKNSAQ